MAKEGQNLAADKTNQDFIPNKVRIDLLTELKNFCDAEVQICQEAIEDIKNPTNQYLTNLQQDVNQTQKKIDTLNQELAKQKELLNLKIRDSQTRARELSSIESTIRGLKNQISETQQNKKQEIETLNTALTNQQQLLVEKTDNWKASVTAKKAIESAINSLKNDITTAQETVNTIQNRIQQTQKYEPTRKNLQEAMKNPKHRLARDAKRIRRRQEVASEALGFINQAIENEKKFYSTERMDHISVASLTINTEVLIHPRCILYGPIKGVQEDYKTASLDKVVINYLNNPILSAEFEKFLHRAEKLAKARNDDERYQPLKDIMDAMIIILAKASSMAMPAGLVDITIKALGAIGGHLADIIKEDFMAIRDKPKNPTQLAALNKKKEELEKTIDNSIQAAQATKTMVGYFLTETATDLGLTVDSKQQISEEFIKTLEKKIESRQKENLKPEEVNSLNQATSNIKLYRGAQTNLEKSQLDKEKLNNLNQDAEKPKKATERKSVKQMREELKITRDKTYKDKVRTEQQQAKLNTR